MTGKSPLPPGFTFQIWPTYRLEFQGRQTKLPKGEAEILMFLMSQPGRSFSAREIANAVYAHREDGGPDLPKAAIATQIFNLRVRLRHAGIDLRLKSPLTQMSIVYNRDSLRVLETPKAAVERLGIRLRTRGGETHPAHAPAKQHEWSEPVQLPPGVKFHIHPVYCLEVEGVSVYPGAIQAEILMFLMSSGNRVYSAREIARTVYASRKSEMPVYAEQSIMAHICNLRKLCRVAGIELTLKQPGMARGYTFVNVVLADKGRAELRRREVVGRKNLPRQPRKKQAADDRNTDTSNWAFPERHERNRQPAREQRH